jgi:hypothetical protein
MNDTNQIKACGCGMGYCAHENNPSPPNGRKGNLALTILVVLALFSVAVWIGLTLPAGGPDVPHTGLAQLELLALETKEEGGGAVVTGRVRNIFNETLQDVRVTVTQRDENGTVMDVASAPISEEVLQPARTSAFEVVFKDPNSFNRWDSANVKFHRDGVEILFHRKRSSVEDEVETAHSPPASRYGRKFCHPFCSRTSAFLNAPQRSLV